LDFSDLFIEEYELMRNMEKEKRHQLLVWQRIAEENADKEALVEYSLTGMP